MERRGKSLVIATYHFAQQEHILTAHDKDPSLDIGVQLPSINSFDGILEHKVCCKERASCEKMTCRVVTRHSYRIGPSFARRRSVSSRRARQEPVSLQAASVSWISKLLSGHRSLSIPRTICQVQQLSCGREHLRWELRGAGGRRLAGRAKGILLLLELLGRGALLRVRRVVV